MTHSMPTSTCRSSRLGRHTPGFCSENGPLTRSHCWSVRTPSSSWEPGHGRRRYAPNMVSPPMSDREAGMLHFVALLVAPTGDGLVGASPERPSELEVPLLFGSGHRADHASYLGYGGRGQPGIGIRFRSPLLPVSHSSSANERSTERQAWASSESVTRRYQPSHFLTSYSSNSLSSLASSKHSSILQDLPAARASAGYRRARYPDAPLRDARLQEGKDRG